MELQNIYLMYYLSISFGFTVNLLYKEIHTGKKLQKQKKACCSRFTAPLTKQPYKLETLDMTPLFCMQTHSSLRRDGFVFLSCLVPFSAKEHITTSLCFIVFSKLINGMHSGKNRYENVYFALLKSPSTKGYQQLLQYNL